MDHRRLIALIGLVGLLGCDAEPAPPSNSTTTADRTQVAALGRLEPGLGVIDVGSPPGERTRRLTVAEGDTVAAGQVVAILESFDERRTEVEVRRALAEEARNRLIRAREVGPLAVAAREATVRRIEADLALAKSDLRRSRELVASEVVPERDQEFNEASVAQVQASLDEARSQLERERRERQLAIREAAAALATAEAELARAEASFAQSEIRAPVDGEVLDLLVLAGESTGGGPILRLGEAHHMYAVAEVYETDARFVRPGQEATVTSPALPAPLTGKVAVLADLVHKNDVLGIDPAADTDSRVLEALILLDDSETAARFVHLQVDVLIDVAGGASTVGASDVGASAGSVSAGSATAPNDSPAN
ncbi:MAG: efflux RND transporter periplasmic adaptor subunit [Acidobacteriota bacterium]